MLRTEENETEILLGNKQLLGIFVVVAVLLGISFAGGYMVGRGSTKKTSLPDAAATETTHSQAGGGQTHTISPDAATPDALQSPDNGSVGESGSQGADTSAAEPPLGSHRRKEVKTQPVKDSKPESVKAENIPASSVTGYTPHGGSQYLQVAAVGRDEAEAVADVLQKKGFRAHAVPKPGNNKVYRVIIGPVRDAGDLSSTRDALHNTGFREVIVQRY